MRRLTGDSAGFLYLESPRQSAHVVYLAELRSDGPPLTFEELRTHVAGRLDILPSFRWRVERVPFGLHHPVFVDDPAFDLDFHLRHDRVPAPGGPAEVDEYMSRLAEKFLDRRHPLWQITLLDGLAREGSDARQALAIRFHHAILDGTAARTTLSRLLDDATAAGAGPEPEYRPEHPRRSRLLVDAVRDQVHQLGDVRPLVRDSLDRLKAEREKGRELGVRTPMVLKDTPPAPFNRAFSNHRRYARAELDLADFLAVKNAAGVSVNDVALGVVAGAVRGYLLDRGELPDRSLLANIPVAIVDPDAPPRQWGNAFTNFMTTLATDEPDPWERLQTIRTVTRAARLRLEAFGLDTAGRWLAFAAPWISEPFNRRLARLRPKYPDRSEANVLCSNMRMTDRHYRFGRTEVERLLLSGPPNDGNGLNITLTSYGGHASFVVLTNGDVVPEPAEMAQRLRAALDELVELAAEHRRLAEPLAVIR